jgi:predicted sulfurtransferase
MELDEGGPRKKSLGSWFPSATQIKVQPYDCATISIALFYQYMSPLWSESRKEDAITFIESRGARCNIGGRIRVAREGINATLSGPSENVQNFITQLKTFDSRLNGTEYKLIHNLPLDRAFKDLRVLPVKEIVYYGIAPEEDLGPGGIYLRISSLSP